MLAHAPPRTPEEKRLPPAPIEFPSEAQVPESQLHLHLRTILYYLLLEHLGAGVTVCSDQFVYWVADDPRQSVAPDVFVKRTPRGELVRSWKVWERGAPEITVEIVSDSDDDERAWAVKLARYRQLGIQEVVRFDAREDAGRRLRVWDYVGGDLVERTVTGDCIVSRVLELTWVVGPADGHPVALRIARDERGEDRLPTQAEAREQEAKARAQEAKARQAAERRVAELEAELRRRGG